MYKYANRTKVTYPNWEDITAFTEKTAERRPKTGARNLDGKRKSVIKNYASKSR